MGLLGTLLELQAQLDRQEPPDHQEPLVQLDRQEPLVQLDHQEPPDHQEPLVQLELQVLKEQLDLDLALRIRLA
jgi:hypothetical protein